MFGYSLSYPAFSWKTSQCQEKFLLEVKFPSSADRTPLTILCPLVRKFAITGTTDFKHFAVDSS